MHYGKCSKTFKFKKKTLEPEIYIYSNVIQLVQTDHVNTGSHLKSRE